VKNNELGGLVETADQAHPNGSLITDGQNYWFVDFEKRNKFTGFEQIALLGFDTRMVVEANNQDLKLSEINN
jgi:hypothetical protein